MSTAISNSFVTQYESEVHMVFQRMGSLLRNTVRTKNNVKGSSTTFQKIGKGTASQKSGINATVPTMSVAHTAVSCTLADWYAADLVDSLDETKINHDERRVIVETGAFALGRKVDDLIRDELDGTGNTVSATAGYTLAKVQEAFEILADNDALNSGRLYGVVGAEQWNELMALSEFSSSDFIGANDLPFVRPGHTGRFWYGTTWFLHPGLTKASNIRDTFWYNSLAAGHAIGTEITSDFDWDGERQAWRITNRMSQGACLIDDTGVVMIQSM